MIYIKKPSKISTKIPNSSKYVLSTNTTYFQRKLEINNQNWILASKYIAIKIKLQTELISLNVGELNNIKFKSMAHIAPNL